MAEGSSPNAVAADIARSIAPDPPPHVRIAEMMILPVNRY
jgi:hypothetical protein